MHLKEHARKLKQDIPTLFLCLKDPQTPPAAKRLAAICLAEERCSFRRYVDQRNAKAVVLCPPYHPDLDTDSLHNPEAALLMSCTGKARLYQATAFSLQGYSKLLSVP